MSNKNTRTLQSAILLNLFLLASAASAFGQATTEIVAKQRAQETLSKKGKGILANHGQWYPRPDGKQAWALSQGADQNVWHTSQGLTIDKFTLRTSRDEKGKEVTKRVGHAISLDFVNANPQATFVGGEEIEGRRTDFMLPGKLRITNAKSYRSTYTKNVYPGIDFKFYQDPSGRPRYDFLIAPGANPGGIAFQIKGSSRFEVDPRGDLVIYLESKDPSVQLDPIKISGPFSYQYTTQSVAGSSRTVKKKVQSRFVVDQATGSVKIQVGAYDRSKQLIIDPLVYGTHLGGSADVDEIWHGINGPGGEFITTGRTAAADFPITDIPYVALGGGDVFVTVFNRDAFDVVYSIMFGGAGNDIGLKLALDPSGTVVYLGGRSNSDLPTDLGFFGTFTGAQQVFLMAFLTDPSGALIPFYGSLLDIPVTATATIVAEPCLTGFGVGPLTGIVYLAGSVNEGALAGLGAVPFLPNGEGDGVGGDLDGYLRGLTTDFLSAPTDVFLPNMIGGVDVDPGGNNVLTGMGIDSNENIYVCGTMFSNTNQDTATALIPRFPTLGPTHDSGRLWPRRIAARTQAFIVKFAATPVLPTVEYSALFGGANTDVCRAGAVDADGNFYITGNSNSFDIPRTPGAYDTVFVSTNSKVYAAKFNTAGTEMGYSTGLATTETITSTAIVVDRRQVAYVGGTVGFRFPPAPPGGPTIPGSIVFPAGVDEPPLSAVYAGGTEPIDAMGAYTNFPSTRDAWLAAVRQDGRSLAYVTYIGALGDEVLRGLTINPSGSLWAYGSTSSVFHVTTGERRGLGIGAAFISPNAFKPIADVSDGWLTMLRVALPTLSAFTVAPSPIAGGPNPPYSPPAVGDSSTVTVTLAVAAPAGGAVVRLTSEDANVASWSPTTAVSSITITVPQGQTTATAPVYSREVLVQRDIELIADIDGDSRRTTTLSVRPFLSAFSTSPTEVVGGNSVTARITLSRPAVPQGILVNLSSDNPLATFSLTPGGAPITSITIPSGQLSSQLFVNTGGTATATTARLTATALGVGLSTNLRIIPSGPLSMTFNPSRVNGGMPARLTVTLSGEGPATVVITQTAGLPIDSPALPFNLNIPSGQRSASVDIVPAFQPSPGGSITMQGAIGATTTTASLIVDHTDLASLSISPATVRGGSNATGTLTLTQPASNGGLLVNLSAAPGSLGSVPATVLVPAGSTTVTFPVTTNAVTSNQTLTVTASKTGYTTRTATLSVTATSILNLTLNPSSVAGGVNSQGTVTIDSPAPVGGFVVSLSSNNAAATVPPSVTILAGQTSAVFTITTTVVTTNQQANITATLGASSRMATLLILAASIVSFSFDPAEVVGGSDSTATITIDQPAPPGGLVISLTANLPQFVTFPATVTIPAGQRSVSFTVGTNNVSRRIGVVFTANGQFSGTLYIRPDA